MTVESTLAHELKTSVFGSQWKTEYDANLALLDPDRITSGLLSSRPAAGKARRFYYATDTGKYFYDNGSAWVEAAPSSAHSHAEGDVTGLTSALAGKASSVHTHAIGDTAVLQAALDGKSAATHNHDAAYEAKNANIQSHIASVSNPHGVTAEQAGAAAASHTHGVGDISGGTANQIIGVNGAGTGKEYKTISVGTAGSDVAVAHAANGITINIPDASATARGIVTTGAQTFSGTKTFTSPVVANVAPGEDFTLTQNSVAPFKSVNSGAIADTLVLSAGKVGIGTAAPDYQLHVKSSSTTCTIKVEAIASGNARLELITVPASSALGALIDANDDIIFRPDVDGSATSVMSIIKAGAVANTLVLKAGQAIYGGSSAVANAKAHIIGTSGSNPASMISHSLADVEGECLRIGRTDTFVDRFHSFKAKHSSTQASNYVALHVHDISTSSSQTEVMRWVGSGNVLIGTTTDGMTAGGSLAIAQDLAHRGTKVGFFNTAPTTKPTITGSRGGNAALASLLTALAALGIITDSTTA